MHDAPSPDASEKRLRFGCGLIFGGGIAFLFFLRVIATLDSTFWALTVAAALLSGFLAMRYGDEFWHRAIEWLRWW